MGTEPTGAGQEKPGARAAAPIGKPPEGFATWEEFAAEARRQSRLVAESPYEEDDQAFVECVSGWIWEDDD